ncbi:uncharacterized protein [Spinacia oleracea]|uniref:Uncharacterized protein n=1 Tax=Spinacia oleracea TaxID=3562 RepID=A0ABM3QSC9_SPIOL|nr:uncharacterized protein LOC110776883 [Spinacia oleracea]XP_056686271.1 uncharacterized protein LOC110776883 [Spinacia oleracea]XP_056686272.1 uncharacterized protein LOC110776883 [Spinacia oleracea]
MEAISESGHASGSNRGEPVTARLLFPCSQANMLDMADTAGADVKILEGHSTHATLVGSCEYSDVHTYLLQVTWTLRENIFSSMKIMPPGPPLLPNILYGQPPRVLAATTIITHEMDNLAISNNTNISSSPVVPSSESSFGHTQTMFTKNQAAVVASSRSSELGRSILRAMRLMLLRKLMWFMSNGLSFSPASIHY